jgi:2-isopropylmalate synthase
MWSALRDRRLEGSKFRRQHPIGDCIADFACVEHQLVVEIDGGQHADNLADLGRSARLQTGGWKVIRFWNNDALANTNAVVETILRVLKST